MSGVLPPVAPEVWPVLAAVAMAGSLVVWIRPHGPSGSLPGWAFAAVAVFAIAGLGVAAPGLAVGAMLAAGAASGCWLLWRSGSRRAEAEARGARVLEACGVLASELAAGQPAVVALGQAAVEWRHLAPAAEAADLGADVPDSLRALSLAPGAGGLTLVAAAWQVAHHTGQGLTSSLQVVVDDLRSERETRRVVASELASARATGRLVAALPLAALAMGRGAGGDPIGFVLHQPLGWLCAASGIALLLAGLAWIEAIAAGVAREG